MMKVLYVFYDKLLVLRSFFIIANSFLKLCDFSENYSAFFLENYSALYYNRGDLGGNIL